MLGFLHDHPFSEPLSADICVVGAGPAGITLALELAKKHSVLVLEAGGESVTSTSQELYQGEVVGTILPEHYLSSSRLRCLGGTSGHWAGWCLPFEAHDLEEKPWLSQAAWPISFSDLETHYPRAANYLELADWSALPKKQRVFPAPFAASANWHARDFHISPPTRFAEKYRSLLAKHPRITLLLKASVSNLSLSEQSTAVSALECTAKDGSRYQVRAKQFILACGAIENARLLLGAPGMREFTKQFQWLGRGFSDHVEITVGILLAPEGSFDATEGTLRPHAAERQLRVYSPDLALLREHQLPNFAVQCTSLPRERCPLEVQDYLGVREELLGVAHQPVHVRLRMEPRIEFANGLTLSEEKDRFGLPRSVLHWNLTSKELEDVRTSARIVADELVRAHNCAFYKILPEDEPWRHAQFASHHTGMTRMSSDPLTGVVDSDLQVHGLTNLSIASSSVFPSAAVANPTLSIVALSTRLAERIDYELSKESQYEVN